MQEETKTYLETKKTADIFETFKTQLLEVYGGNDLGRVLNRIKSTFYGKSATSLLNSQNAELGLLFINQLSGYEEKSNSGADFPEVEYLSKRYKLIVEKLGTQNWESEDHFKLLVYFLGEEKAAYARHAWNQIPFQMYQTGYTRRSFRSPNDPELWRRHQINFIVRIIAQSYTTAYDSKYNKTHTYYDLTIVEQIRYNHVLGETNPQLFRLWAAAIDMGNAEVFQSAEDIIFNRDPEGKVTRSILKALLNSGQQKSWELVEKLTLAAQKQEGLRQTIFEALDETSIGALKYMIRVIIDHNLARFSSVVRAVDVWAGLGWETERENTVRSFLEKASYYLENENEIPKGVYSENNADTYMALWAQGVYDVEKTMPFLEELVRTGNVQKRTLAVLFAEQTANYKIRMPIFISVLGDSELQPLGTTAALIYHTVQVGANDKYYNHYYPHLFDMLHTAYKRVTVKEKIFESFIFSWMKIHFERRNFLKSMVCLVGDSTDRLNLVVGYVEEMDADTKRMLSRKILPKYTDYHFKVLVGGGLTVFYFTIAFAFHQYQLISQSTAFGIMVIITIFAVTLSILYDRIELGILATVGGFITPFLVSHGDGNWFALFSYLSILNAGLIVLAYYKRWRIINFIAFFFTQIIYISWIVSKIGSPGFNYQGIFIFGLIFYLMFLVMNIIHHVVRASKLLAFDFIILLTANLCFFGAGIYLIESSGVSQYRGLFAASLGVVNLILAYLFFKRSEADKKFIYLLIGITISFLTIAAPVQLKGHYITLFWSAETVVLLWLYQKSFINLLKISVLVVTVLMFFSLIMDWDAIYVDDNTIHAILFNKGWITGIFSSAALFFVYRLLIHKADTFYIWGITNKLLRNIYLAGAVLLLFTTGALEINDQFQKRTPSTGLEVIYVQLYLTVFVLLLLFIIQKLKFPIHPFLRVAISFAAICTYLFNFLNYQTVEEAVLDQGKFKGYFLADWMNALLLLALIWNLILFIRNNKPVFGKYWLNLTWIISAICVIIFSSEIANGFVWLNYTDKPSFQSANELFDKAGLTIVWAVSSFTMIWLGMKYSYKPLRITALILFGITLIKLFMFDIKDIAPGGKIIAFILLGVLLLVISFMYQRLKKIIIDDTETHV